MITNARFVSIYVKDQKRALDFWTNKLEFELLLDAPYEEGSSQRWIEVKPPKGDTYLVLGLADEDTEKLVGQFGPVWFDCDDIDATYEDLKGKGVEFAVPPSDAPWSPGTRWAQFSDPDGNIYGISQRA